MDDVTPGVHDGHDVLADGPVEFVGRQGSRFGVGNFIRAFPPVGTGVEVTELELQLIAAVFPYPPDGVVFVDHEHPAGLEDAAGLPVEQGQVGYPHGDMAAGIDEVERSFVEVRQVGNVGADEADVEPELRSAFARDAELFFRYVHGRHMCAQAGEREHDTVVTTAEDAGLLARQVAEPFQLLLVEGDGRVLAALAPVRLGPVVGLAGRCHGVPALAVCFMHLFHPDGLRLRLRIVTATGRIARTKATAK